MYNELGRVAGVVSTANSVAVSNSEHSEQQHSGEQQRAARINELGRIAPINEPGRVAPPTDCRRVARSSGGNIIPFPTSAGGLQAGAVSSDACGTANKPRYTNEHKGQPLKDDNDIRRVANWFAEHDMDMMRCIFIVGINTGYRISDILSLRWDEVLRQDGTVTELPLSRIEQKTSRCGKRPREVFLNAVVRRELLALRAAHPELCMASYVFQSEIKDDCPVTRQFVDKWLRRATADLGIAVRAGTHMMRKTFAYHHIVKAKDRARALEHLMLLLGHSSVAVTLHYAGITEDELHDTYEGLQLGV